MQAKTAPSKPFFSIIIPTLNEARRLPLLLRDLAKQTNTSFEVVHVDGQSEDQTIAKAEKFRKLFPLTSLSTDVRNVAYQRNLGAQQASGEWLIFMDADNRIPRYFLDGIKYQIAKSPETELFTTWAIVDGANKTFNQPIELAINFSLEVGKLINKEWAFGALIGVKKSVLSKKFLFDDKQKVAEDVMFISKLVQAGHSFTVFKEPKYSYSLRRMRAEGTLNHARKSARILLNYLQAKDFSATDFGYKMEGGKVYEKLSRLHSNDFQNFLANATTKQLDYLKKIISGLRQ